MPGKWFKGIVPTRDEPIQIDTSVAHPARVYDYLLGGKDNYPADRAAGDAAAKAAPAILLGVRANRKFLARAVRYLAGECGIRQFLDIGTGLPSADNTHEVAQSVAADCRVVYVDNDPIVLAHARALLTSTQQGATAYIDADARDTELIAAQAARTLDFSKPVAVMALLILQYIPDANDPQAVVSRLLDAVPSGSYLVTSDTTGDIDAAAVTSAAEQLNAHMPTSITLRTREQISLFHAGLDLAEPGLVPLNRWRPSPDDPALDRDLPAYCGVGRKP